MSLVQKAKLFFYVFYFVLVLENICCVFCSRCLACGKKAMKLKKCKQKCSGMWYPQTEATLKFTDM